MELKKIFNKSSLQQIFKSSNIKFDAGQIFNRATIESILQKLSARLKLQSTLKKLSNQLKITLIFKKIDSVILVDIRSNLKLLHIGLKGNITLNALRILPLPDSEDRNEVIVSSIRKFIQDNGIQNIGAILQPQLNSLLIKRLQLPAMPETELLSAIKWQIKDYLSFDVSAAMIDFTLLRETTTDEGAKIFDCQCVAVFQQEVKSQVNLLKQAGLDCIAVIPIPFGYTGLVSKYLGIPKEETVAFLHLDEDCCFISIYKDEKLEFHRDIALSINKLRDMLKGTLVTDFGEVVLDPEEIEEVLFKYGVPEEEFVYRNKLKSVQILFVLRPALERLAGEVKRSLVYYNSQFQPNAAIKNIILAGHGVEIPNLDVVLSKELSLKIEKLNLSDKIATHPSIDKSLLSQVYASFGLAQDYSSSVNLLPYELRTQKIERFEKLSLRMFSFAAILLLIIAYIFVRIGIINYQRRLNNAVLQLNVLSEVNKAKSELEATNKFIVQIRSSALPTDLILKQLSMIVRKDMLLDNASFDFNVKSGTIEGTVKSAAINSDAILTQFIKDMEDSIYFTNVNISSVEKEEREEEGLVRFSISFKLL